MERNTHPEFVGTSGIKKHQRAQLEVFMAAAEQGDWLQIHEDHYDWWMFPVNEASSGQGWKFTVLEGDIAELKQDTEFMRSLLLGIELEARAWGWDLKRACYIDKPQPGQSWRYWPVRLYKAAKCAKLFGFQTEFDSLKKFAQDLMANHDEEMTYAGHDLSWLFRD